MSLKDTTRDLLDTNESSKLVIWVTYVAIKIINSKRKLPSHYIHVHRLCDLYLSLMTDAGFNSSTLTLDPILAFVSVHHNMTGDTYYYVTLTKLFKFMRANSEVPELLKVQLGSNMLIANYIQVYTREYVPHTAHPQSPSTPQLVELISYLITQTSLNITLPGHSTILNLVYHYSAWIPNDAVVALTSTLLHHGATAPTLALTARQTPMPSSNVHKLIIEHNAAREQHRLDFSKTVGYIDTNPEFGNEYLNGLQFIDSLLNHS